MTNRELIKKIRGHFWKLTQRKTSYGRNEVQAMLDEACANALASILDDLQVMNDRELEAAQDDPIQQVMEAIYAKDKPPTNAVGDKWVNPLREDRPCRNPMTGEGGTKIQYKAAILDSDYFIRDPGEEAHE